MSTFANKLKGLRISRGMSEKELANLIGVNAQTISRYENGGNPRTKNVIKICKAFNVSMQSLLDDSCDLALLRVKQMTDDWYYNKGYENGYKEGYKEGIFFGIDMFEKSFIATLEQLKAKGEIK